MLKERGTAWKAKTGKSRVLHSLTARLRQNVHDQTTVWVCPPKKEVKKMAIEGVVKNMEENKELAIEKWNEYFGKSVNNED